MASFWSRQFTGRPTPIQITFDILFGMIVPVLCLVFDPIVFRSDGEFGGGGLGFLGAYRFEAYFFIGIEIVALAIWLAIGSRLARQASMISGVLYCGFAGAALVGLVMLPLTLIGLLFIIGALGFMPFFTAIIFLRNAVRAGALARSVQPRRQVALATVLGLLVAVAVTANGNRAGTNAVDSALAAVVSDDPAAAHRAEAFLRAAGPFIDFDPLVWRYDREPEGPRKERIAQLYQRLTGDEIDGRLSILLD